jgi:hypothetical protein
VWYNNFYKMAEQHIDTEEDTATNPYEGTLTGQPEPRAREQMHAAVHANSLENQRVAEQAELIRRGGLPLTAEKSAIVATVAGDVSRKSGPINKEGGLGANKANKTNRTPGDREPQNQG